jgi:glycosyltransferase involved in cell wall biosynthesis
MTDFKLDLSVLLATRNRAQLLKATLSHFARLDTHGISWEVIVVDNGSTDATPEVLERARGRLPLSALYEPLPGKNRAINRALAVASGELLIFTDDDIEPDARWLTEYLAAARRWREYSIFGGPVIPKFPPDTPRWLQEHRGLADSAFAAWSPTQGEGRAEQLPFGPNFAIRAERLSGMRFSEKMGSKGADTDLMGGELELLGRLHAAGERPIFVPSAPVRHVITPSQLDRGWLLRRMFRTGRTVARLKLDTRAMRFRGVPHYLWRGLLFHSLRYTVFLLGPDHARFNAALAVYQVRGRMYEYVTEGEAGVLARMLHP